MILRTLNEFLKWIYKGNEILILRTLNEFLKWIFMRNILRKVSYSKIKEIILKKTTKYMRQKIRQNKIKQNHQVEILITQKKLKW